MWIEQDACPVRSRRLLRRRFADSRGASKVKGRIHVGTSGWNYAHWRGTFYPPGLAQSRWLSFLASRLPTVEINATFYGLTTPRACERWRAAVPPEFLFAVKGSRFITHMKRLRGVRTALANFFASGILRLGVQMGPILWQLPPSLRFDPALGREFFRILPRDLAAAQRLARRHDARVKGRCALTSPDGGGVPIRYALEARHASWMQPEALEFLNRWRVALVWADTAGTHPSAASQTTPDLAYARLHGARQIYQGRYTVDELRQWRVRCRRLAADGANVFVYFDNDRNAAATADAEELNAMLDGAVPAPRPRSSGVKTPETPTRPKPDHFNFRKVR